MRLARNSKRNGGISARLTDVADGVGRLVSEHIALARAELTQELDTWGKSLGRVAGSLSLLLVGYAFLCAALVAYLASKGMSTAAALLLVGAANLVVGAVGVYPPLRRISQQRLLRDSLEEFDTSAAKLLGGGGGQKARVADDERL
ncbi:MAG TPA: phage holin family protein [Myxococcaceae bacterium]|nr:phage holin family protein [Myxococcaceae bacterium]